MKAPKLGAFLLRGIMCEGLKAQSELENAPGEIGYARLVGDLRGVAPAFALLQRPKRLVAFSRTTEFEPSTPRSPNKKPPEKRVVLYLARPERFELPTARFVAGRAHKRSRIISIVEPEIKSLIRHYLFALIKQPI